MLVGVDWSLMNAPLMTRGVRARGPLPQVRIAESVAAELRKRILTAREGSVLPKQDEIVAEFGVSYPSVREALRILETEGLITVRRGNMGGADIHRPDPGSAAYALGLALQASQVRLADLAEGLLCVEPLCAALCAQRADRKQAVVALLRANIAASKAAIDDGLLFTHTARQFHDLIVTSTGNKTLGLVVHSLVALWTSQEEAWAESLSSSGTYFTVRERKAVVSTHQVIADRIEQGDAAGAQKAAEKHIAQTQKLFLTRFNDEVVDAASARNRRNFGPMR